MFKVQFTLIIGLIFVVGCDDSQTEFAAQRKEDLSDTQDKHADGKSDAWNSRNNPSGLRIELNKTLAELPMEGQSDNQAWPDTYWPTYKDSTNARWQSTGEFLKDLSPSEKYDVVFNNWDPFSVEGLRPFDASNCDRDSFDVQYYDHLGPLAAYVSEYKGNKATRTAVLAGELESNCKAKQDSQCIADCGEKPEDTEEQSHFNRCVERCDRGGVETWWGLCHAWAPAAILEKEPLHPVMMPTDFGDITFEVSDIKALFAIAYDRSQAALIGGRCNDFEVKRDERTGRITNDDCRDLNAGSFHVATANLLGIQKRGFVEDRTFDYEVWNQPVSGFEVLEMEEIPINRAHDLLNVDPEMPTDCQDDFEGKDNQYCYNSNIDTLVRVKTKLHWLTESHASTRALGHEHLERYSRTDTYDYILEVQNNLVVGGEWYGNSIENHPDFVWLPFRHGSLPRHFDVEQVQLLNELAQKSPQDQRTLNTFQTFASDALNLAIPDNDPEGIMSTLRVEIDDQFPVGTVVKLDVNIAHPYSGDLKIVLISPDGKEYVAQDREGGSTANIEKRYDIKFDGEASGQWQLRISDLFSRDMGTLTDWSLSFVAHTSGEGDASIDPLEVTNNRPANIPDHDQAGIQSYIDVTSEGIIGELEVSVDITHTYIGDLTVTLRKGGVSQVLHNREGGQDDDLKRGFQTQAFKGLSMKGRWYLIVSDHARHDLGTRNQWSLKFTPR